MKCIQTKRKLLKLEFNGKDDATTHLAKFEKIINEVNSSGKEMKEDNVITYFDSLPAGDKKMANLKARFIEEWSNQISQNSQELSESSKTEDTLKDEEKTAFATTRHLRNFKNNKFN